MNDFSKDTQEFLYSEDYKEPVKVKFYDVSGSMGNIRILPTVVQGGESIQYNRRIYVYSGKTADRIREEGQRTLNRINEIFEENGIRLNRSRD